MPMRILPKTNRNSFMVYSDDYIDAADVKFLRVFVEECFCDDPHFSAFGIFSEHWCLDGASEFGYTEAVACFDSPAEIVDSHVSFCLNSGIDLGLPILYVRGPNYLQPDIAFACELGYCFCCPKKI